MQIQEILTSIVKMEKIKLIRCIDKIILNGLSTSTLSRWILCNETKYYSIGMILMEPYSQDNAKYTVIPRLLNENFGKVYLMKLKHLMVKL